MRQVERLVMVLLIVLVVVLGYRSCNQAEEISNRENLNKSLKDTLSTYKNKNGKLVSRIKTLNVTRVGDFLNIASKDTTVNKLKSLVREYENRLDDTGSAGVLSLKGSTDVVTDTKITYSELDKPIYNSKFNLDNWVWGTVKATKDSTMIDLTYREEIDFVIGKENTGFLGLKNEYFSDVKLENPYSEVESFRTYNTKIDLPKFALTVGLSGTYSFQRQQTEVYPTITLGYILWSK